MTRDILKELKLPHVKIVTLKEFETKELLRIKGSRTKGEYCWTCTAATILHTLNKFRVPEVTYLDSDLFFFDKPSIVLQEFRDSKKDVLITRHNYTPEYDQTRNSGVYCVQFMTFKNNKNGKYVLNWWKDRCIEWCYARIENGKFGDQKYLDDWTERFDGIHVMQNKAAGLAPWNIQQYEVKEGPIINGMKAIFYHFHSLKWFRTNQREWFGHYDDFYKMNEDVGRYIYNPYIAALINSMNVIRQNYDDQFIKGIEYPESRIY